MASYPFTAEGAKRAEKDLLVSLCGLSVLCGEMWVITRKPPLILPCQVWYNIGIAVNKHREKVWG